MDTQTDKRAKSQTQLVTLPMVQLPNDWVTIRQMCQITVKET